jgi:NACHT domain
MRLGWVRIGLATALLAVLTGAFGLVWWLRGEGTSAAVATVAAAVLTVAVPLVSWAFGSSLAADAGQDLDRLAENLARIVRLQWEDEADVRQLRDPQPVGVRWRAATSELMDHPDVIVPELRPGQGRSAGRLQLAGEVDTAVDQYRRLPRRRLVVIGEPGAGKTGVLVLLTLGLLERRMPDEPVPVLLSMASWNPLQEPFLRWLPRHLAREYAVVRRSGRAEALVADGRVLPILDGLDELPEDRVAGVLAAINRVGVQQAVVIASRTAEFARAVREGDVLTGAAVIELEPVTPEQAAEYLRVTSPQDDRLARWTPVFARLRSGSHEPVSAALSTPMMVSLARTVYAGREMDPGELTDGGRFPTAGAIEARLLDALVPAQLAARRERSPTGSPRYAADRAQRWLVVLARDLQQRGTRDLAWWELSMTRLGSIIAAGGVAGVAGLEAGLVLGLLTAIGVGHGAGIVPGVGGGLLAGLSLGGLLAIRYAAAIGFGLDAEQARLEGLQFVADLGGGLVGLGVGLTTGIAVGLRVAFTPGVVVGPIVALVAGAVLGLVLGYLGSTTIWLLPVEPASPRAPRPARIDWRVRHSLGPGLGVGLGAVLTLMGGLVSGPLGVLAAGVGVALAFGLAGALGNGFISERDRPPAPAASVRADRIAVLAALVTVGLGAGAAGWIVVGGRLGAGPEVGVGVGLAAALVAAAHRPWAWYQLWRARGALSGQIPWRFMTFLEECHRLGVLRQVGAVYQFRHARLQDRLAGADQTPP